MDHQFLSGWGVSNFLGQEIFFAPPIFFSELVQEFLLTSKNQDLDSREVLLVFSPMVRLARLSLAVFAVQPGIIFLEVSQPLPLLKN